MLITASCSNNLERLGAIALNIDIIRTTGYFNARTGVANRNDDCLAIIQNNI